MLNKCCSNLNIASSYKCLHIDLEDELMTFQEKLWQPAILQNFERLHKLESLLFFLRIIFKVIGIYYFHLPPNVAKQISTCGSVFTKTLIMYLGLFYYDFSFITFFLVAIF